MMASQRHPDALHDGCGRREGPGRTRLFKMSQQSGQQSKIRPMPTGAPASVGGTWAVTIQYTCGLGEQHFTLKQDGNTVTGDPQGRNLQRHPEGHGSPATRSSCKAPCRWAATPFAGPSRERCAARPCQAPRTWANMARPTLRRCVHKNKKKGYWGMKKLMACERRWRF